MDDCNDLVSWLLEIAVEVTLVVVCVWVCCC